MFNGYLIKAVKTGAILPLQYIEWSSYKITPNQREEIKAYRDDNTRNLTRITASGKKTAIEMKLRAMWLEDMMEFQAWLNNAIENTAEAMEQRKVELEIYDTENNVYKSSYFYVPNIEYNILKITNTSIKYKSQTLKFIEY